MALGNLTFSQNAAMALVSFAALWMGPSAELVAGSYDQMVLVLDQKPYYHVQHDAANGVLTIDLRKVSQQQLDPLKLYDADLVSRVWLEKRPDQMTRISLYLKDPAIRYAVRSHSHPHRLAIELYTEGTLEARDPRTGLPLLPSGDRVPNHRQKLADTARSQPSSHRLARPRPAASRASTAADSAVAFSAKPLVSETSPPRAGRKRRLLQPIPVLGDDPTQRMAELSAIKGGKLAGWQSFPDFVYRINTASYKNSENYQRFLAGNKAALANPHSNLSSLARYAAKQYDFGHEHRSLAAYRYILQNAPALFNGDPLHLWRMAELNLGSRNFALAKGYYQAVINQFPTSEMAGFSRLRLADLLWLGEGNALRPSALTKAMASYRELAKAGNGELASQAIIRMAYLSHAKGHSLQETAGTIPEVSAEDTKILRRHSRQLESPKTVFFSRAITLGHLLRHKPGALTTAAPMVAEFVRSYQKQPDPAVAAKMQALLKRNVNAQVAKNFTDKDYLGVIEKAKALTAQGSSHEAMLTKASHYAIAESYRELGQYSAATNHYQRYQTKAHTLANFIAGVWQLDAMIKSAELLSGKTAKRRLLKQARIHDKSLWRRYLKLKAKARHQAVSQLTAPIIRLSQNRRFIATPARIALGVWQHSIAPEGASLENPERLPKWQPDGRTVARLTNLKKTFYLQGYKSQTRKVERLLAALDPKLFSHDPIAKKIWTKEILGLAEEYRKSKQYLQAGRMYTLSARTDDGWERRAEALYKGGLLLYRAGKRQEAETAFRQASLDVNNVLYAELAKKRLEQISKP